MQQRMDLFETQLPEWLVHRVNYGLQLYYLGQVMHEQAAGRAFFEQLYHGMHNLDIATQNSLDVAARIQVPHEMLLAMNPSEVLALHAGAWLVKMDADRWREAVNKQNFWQVVSAVHSTVYANPEVRALLRALDQLCEKAYPSEAGTLQHRLRQLPPSVATGFMTAFTHQFQSPNAKRSYAPVERLPRSLDQIVFGHFAGKYAEGERLLSLAKA